ncbi:MAG: RagB/SusD family nutrient uptake outer membrane protein [Bacteroidales bacterium]
MKNLKHILVTLLVLIVCFSCGDDFLENESNELLTDANQWATEKNADIFLNDIYGSLPRWNNTPDQLDNYTDDNDAGPYWQSASWKQGVLTPTVPAFTYTQFDALCDWANWRNAFIQIRKCNLFLQKVKENSENYTDAVWYKKRIDEARFIRAFTYSYMMMHYGGLPIITHPQNRTTEADKLGQPRSTFEETVNFISSELDSIVKNNALPLKYNANDPDAGRVTLGAALVLKGYVELFAASPAFNADIPAAANGTGATTEQIKLAGYGNYDVQRWAKAAATNKQFIESFEGTYKLFPNLATFWTEANEYNEEVIFDKQHIKQSALASNFEVFGGVVWILESYFCWGNYCPTQELVDDFVMANGKPITDPTSGYDTLHPYVNREKRFYDFIVYNGAPYKTSWMPKTDTVFTRIDKVKKSKNQIDFATDDVTNTGYYSKKRVNPDVIPGWGNSGLNYVFFRYAEVLLNYAEAQNEAVGPDATVYDAINKVRARSNVPSLENTYGSSLDQAQMREIIRRERRVELCFENKRFFDIIRWGIAEDVMNKELHGMMITNTIPKNNSGIWIYTKIGIGHPHVFSNKMYLTPIAQSVIDRNSNIIQNPGY